MEQNNQIVLSKSDFIEKDGNYLMPLKKLAKMLGYKNPKKIYDLYNQYKDELQVYSQVCESLTQVPESGTSSGKQILHLNENGCYLVAMFARTEKAVAFRRALAGLLVELRKGNVGILSKAEAEKLQRMHNFWKKIALAREKEAFVRKVRGFNFTKAKVIDRMVEKGIDEDTICEVVDIDWYTFQEYLQYSFSLQKAIQEWDDCVFPPISVNWQIAADSRPYFTEYYKLQGASNEC